jgi:hypothetical protein
MSEALRLAELSLYLLNVPNIERQVNSYRELMCCDEICNFLCALSPWAKNSLSPKPEAFFYFILFCSQGKREMEKTLGRGVRYGYGDEKGRIYRYKDI